LLSGAGAAWAQDKVIPSSRAEIVLSFAPVVKQVAPAVVNIYAQRIVRQRAISPLFDDPFFRRFFGDSFGTERQEVQNSLGSGVIVDESGLVVTNHHVVAGASEITVVLSDRREFAAELVVDDERSDLAVLRIDSAGEKLPVVALKDSDQAQVGDLVLAIGNPFGVGQTVTSGIVSALARTQVDISDFNSFIQTDAAINPGNSGGALVTLDGKLIGINTAIYSRSGGSIGIGFAVPSNMVRTVIASARSGGEIMRPWLGLFGQAVTADLAEGVGLDRPRGVIVSQIYPGGPADQAGLKLGDVIVSVDGRPVHDMDALVFRIATRELGGTATLEVWRERHALTLTLPLAVAPETPPRNITQLLERHPLAGATVANLSPALAEELDLSGAWRGVIVIEIVRASAAHRFGFRAGDLIVAVNEREVTRVSELKEALGRASGRWSITFSRDGRLRSVDATG
jgi:serine protease Do